MQGLSMKRAFSYNLTHIQSTSIALFWTSLPLYLWGSLEWTIIFNPPPLTTLVPTLSNLEGLVMFHFICLTLIHWSGGGWSRGYLLKPWCKYPLLASEQLYILSQSDNNSLISTTITMVLGANPMQLLRGEYKGFSEFRWPIRVLLNPLTRKSHL